MDSIPSVVAGAAIALCGVLLAQLVAMIQSRLDREHKRDILLRTKYEELAEHLNDSLLWATSVLSVCTFEEMQSRTQPIPARKAYTLSLLYFPKLKPFAESYVDASIAFQNTLIENFRPLNGVSAGAQAAKHTPQAFNAAGERLRATREAFDNEIQNCASEYIRA